MEKGLELVNRFGKPIQVGLEISQYVNNGCIYIGLVIFEDGHPEPYANLTVNLREGAPDFCGYIDTNNMPQLENFLVKHDLGYFTGLTQKSGFCTYPLYAFNVERLRKLCPEGMAAYEAQIDAVKQHTRKPEMGR